MLGLILPWWSRWAALGVALVAAMAFGAAKMHQHDLKAYQKLEKEYAGFKNEVARIGAEQEAKTKVTNAQNKAIRAEVELQHESEISDLHKRIDAVSAKLRASSGSRIVPPSTSSPGRVVQPGEVCFDADRLDEGLRRSLGQLLEQLTPIVQRGAEASIGAVDFIEWAGKVGACK